MQPYNANFARIYNERWCGFARQMAPKILNHYATFSSAKSYLNVLDLCCGTGQLGLHFLENGFRVVGIDLSENMLHYARENTALYCQNNQAEFIQADAADFTLEERFGLVVSTYDSLNHLQDEETLKKCFQCVFKVSDGVFIFDLNTKAGLQRINGVQIDESDEMFIITNRFYDNLANKGMMRITGFIHNADGLYERLDGSVSNTAFDIKMVRTMLLETGWQQVSFARAVDLATPVAQPEGEERIVVIAEK